MNSTKPNEKPFHLDFIEYTGTKETFADKEYKKWLAERNAKKDKTSAKLNAEKRTC